MKQIIEKISRFYRLVIIVLYKRIVRKQEFIQRAYEVRVKKGKIRYTLFNVETKDGNYCLNLGRHREILSGYEQMLKVSAK